MSKRAEQRALGAYPRPELHGNSNIHYDLDNNRREGFIEGYEQAEKDLALTWEDVAFITTCFCDLSSGMTLKEFTDSRKNIYQEVLRRFNEQKKNNG